MRLISMLVSLAAAVTPVEKVVTLLGKLQAQVQEEGAKEAAQYDKFSCFCKDSADEKLYVINKAVKKIARLDATIESLNTEIAALASQTAEDKETIAGLETSSEEATAARAAEHETYVAEERDLAKAISAMKRAIDALSASKGEMTEAKLQLVQKEARMAAAFVASSKMEASKHTLRALKSLVSQNPAKYEYHSNDIIAMLQQLLNTFQENKRTLDSEEASTKQAHNLEEQARQYQIKTLNDQVAERQALEAAKSEEKAETQADRDATETARGQDQAYLDDLTSQCEAKATAWDQRSSSRAAELKALAEAIELLKGQVSDNYAANKKLVGLAAVAVKKGSVNPFVDETQTSINARDLEGEEAEAEALSMDTEDAEAAEDAEVEDGSFLQLSPRKRLAALLARQARRLHSKMLSELAAHVEIDHFEKVRGLIKDLVARLEEQASAEATQKQWCDDEMGKATTKRDEAQASIEEKNGKIISAEAKIERLGSEIKALEEDVAELHKQLNEQTVLRAEESKQNKQTVSDATEGQDAVTQAIDVLRGFYNTALLQGKQPAEAWRPEKADASGKTVGDNAPEVFSNDGYSGKTDSSKGIIGILEVIKADFERTVSTVNSAETAAEQQFTEYKTDTEADIGAKNALKDEKAGTKGETESDLVTLQDDLADQQELLRAAKEELAKLAPACVDSGMSWEQRSARREQEVNALKEALDILRSLDLGKGFMQK